MVTPEHIVPEWYFLPSYAILRSIPNKLIGVIALFASLFASLIPLVCVFLCARHPGFYIRIFHAMAPKAKCTSDTGIGRLITGLSGRVDHLERAFKDLNKGSAERVIDRMHELEKETTREYGLRCTDDALLERLPPRVREVARGVSLPVW